MEKLLLIVLASLSVTSAFAASDKAMAAVAKDEKADNAQDKKTVKKASPQAMQSVNAEADKAKIQSSKGQTGSGNSSK